MRKIVLLLICAFICQFVNAQVEKGHTRKFPFPYDVQPSELDIKGNIRSVSYKLFLLDNQFGDIVVDKQIDTAYLEYSEEGHLLKYLTENNNTLFCPGRFNFSLKYDDKGNLITFNEYLEYFYEDGRLVKVHCSRDMYRLYYTNGALSKIDCYNYNNQKLESTEYYQNGDLVKIRCYPNYGIDKESIITYTYRNHKVTNWNGKVYTYNEKGLYSPTGLDKVTYEYDTKGNWIKRYEVSKDKYGNLAGGFLTVRTIIYR